MASVNKTIILGNVGQDPEIRYTPNGDAVCNLSIATSRQWKDKNGDKQEETEWHRVAFYGKVCEVIGRYVKKGNPLYVEGRLKTRKWKDKDGVERYTTEIISESMQLLGGKQEQESRPAPARAKKPDTGTGFDSMDDDIPW